MTDAELDMEPTRQIAAVFAYYAAEMRRVVRRGEPTTIRPCRSCGGPRVWMPVERQGRCMACRKRADAAAMERRRAKRRGGA